MYYCSCLNSPCICFLLLNYKNTKNLEAANNTHLLVHSFLCQKSSEVGLSSLLKHRLKRCHQSWIPLRRSWGRICLEAHSCSWKNPAPSNYSSEILTFLLLKSLWRPHSQVLSMWPPSSSNLSPPLLQLARENVLLLKGSCDLLRTTW